jgi:ribosomal protein S18 acetylase RimI-like enzyme
MSNKNVHGFKRIETTSVNINKYKSQYHGLSHIRSGHGYDGVILIDKNDKFVAVLQCHITDGMVQAIDVSPDYRRQGIAASLLRLASHEFECYKLTVRETNTAAISLYEKHGYKTYKKDGIMLFMEKENVSLEAIKDLITIPDNIIKQAQVDPILSGYLNPLTKRVGIYFKEILVGFYSPYEEDYNGKTYWRTGNIFVMPEYRNKGIASQVIRSFFKDKTYGMAHVAENNPASLKAFEKAGFIKQKDFEMINPKGNKLQLLLKEPIGLNVGFMNW